MKAAKYALSFFFAFSFLVGCSESSKNLIVPKSIIPKEEFSEKPKDFTVFNPKVDILFVIDNSGSMAEAQANLSRNASLFADAISKVSILDYHIGVLTTDMDSYSCRSACGRLQGVPTYIEKSTPNLVDNLSTRMVVGTDGSATEQMFAPVMAALSTPLETSINRGFYRQDAFLAVIFVTDAMEQSAVPPQDFLKFLTAKKGDPTKVLGYGVIRKVAEERICRGMEDLDDKLEEFLSGVSNGDQAQKNVLSLCDNDWGTKLADFAKDIVRRSAGVVKLSRIPNVKTIRVSYGSQVIPNSVTDGWVYQPSTNSILLAEGINWQVQGPNVGLSIDFEVIDIE